MALAIEAVKSKYIDSIKAVIVFSIAKATLKKMVKKKSEQMCRGDKKFLGSRMSSSGERALKTHLYDGEQIFRTSNQRHAIPGLSYCGKESHNVNFESKCSADMYYIPNDSINTHLTRFDFHFYHISEYRIRVYHAVLSLFSSWFTRG